MAIVAVSSVTQTGDIGGSGISRYHWIPETPAAPSAADVDLAHLILHDLYTTLKPLVPNAITYQVEPEVRVIDEASGALVSFAAGDTPQAPIVGAGISATYAGGTGARVNWQTGVVVGRRLLRGATFIVPLDANAFDNRGAITAAAQATLLQAANQWVNLAGASANAAVVYHRPAKGAVAGGVSGAIIAARVTTTPSGLRSRRVLRCSPLYNTASREGSPDGSIRCSADRRTCRRHRLCLPREGVAPAAPTERRRRSLVLRARAPGGRAQRAGAREGARALHPQQGRQALGKLRVGH